MNLPFAARRLFDKSGNELLASINTLERDQVVYISCGEQWIDPKLTYSEHQRRLLLAGLASDVNKIRNYVRLKEQAGRYHFLFYLLKMRIKDGEAMNNNQSFYSWPAMILFITSHMHCIAQKQDRSFFVSDAKSQ